MIRFSLSSLAMFELAAHSCKSFVGLFVVSLLVAVIFVDAKPSQAQDVSIRFLRQGCFLEQGSFYRNASQ